MNARKIRDRDQARKAICDAANRRQGKDKLLGVQPAVCVCRAGNLVSPEVIALAGFNARSPRHAPVRTLVLTAKQQREIAYGLNPVIPPRGVTSGAFNPSRPYRRSWLGRPKAAR